MKIYSALVFALTLAACGGSEPAPAAPEAAAPEAAAFTPDDATLKILADADAADGAVDHVVSQCASCQLHMAGDPARASKVGDYEVHLCSAACKDRFDGDPKGVLAAIPAPAEGAQDEAAAVE